MEAIGVNGRIVLEKDHVTISRKGAGLLTMLNQGLQGDKTIPIHWISCSAEKNPGSSVAITKGPSRASISVADEIEKLALLRDKGLLTEEEFTEKTRQLLGL